MAGCGNSHTDMITAELLMLLLDYCLLTLTMFKQQDTIEELRLETERLEEQSERRDRNERERELEARFMEGDTKCHLSPLRALHAQMNMQYEVGVFDVIPDICKSSDDSMSAELYNTLKDNVGLIKYHVMNSYHGMFDFAVLVSIYPQYVDLFELIPSGPLEFVGEFLSSENVVNHKLISALDLICVTYPGKFHIVIHDTIYKHDSNFIATLTAMAQEDIE